MNRSINNKRVYVAFLDILGFREVVNNNDHEVLSSIYDTKISTDIENIGYFFEINKGVLDDLKIEILAVSDSIILWSQDDSIIDFYMLVLNVKELLQSFFNKGVPLRGAISVGPLSIRKINGQINVFGKALTNSYNLESNQEWTGCVIDQECLDVLDNDEENHLNELMNKKIITKYLVPKKQGKVDEQYVVNWVSETNFKINERKIRESFKSYNKKVDDWSVELKILNTIKFYEKMMNLD